MSDRGTHVLLAGDYTDALEAVVTETLPRVEEAAVLLDLDELDEGFDPSAQSLEVWTAVRDSFEPIDGPGPFASEAVDDTATEQVDDPDASTGRTSFRLVGDTGALERLCTLAAEPVVGQWFLQQVRLTTGGDVVLGAIPHHRHLWVDTDPFQEGYIDSVAEALADCRGCLVPAETRLEWSVGDRTYRLAGGSLCLEHGSGVAGDTCWGLAQVDSVRREGSELVLEWKPDGRALPVRLLSRLLWALLPGASRPERVPCNDPETAERARELLARTLAAYEPELSG